MIRIFLSVVFTITAFISFCQDEVETPKVDTIDIYVINNTNRLVALTSETKTRYAFLYRDLRYLKERRELILDNVDETIHFFDVCEKSLATDKTYVTKGYNINRNKLNKKVVRLNNKQGGYALIKNDTLELMRKAFENTIE